MCKLAQWYYRKRFNKMITTMNPEDECCVCLDTYDKSDCIQLKTCGHILHSQCAWSYFIEYDHELCPLCESDQRELKKIMIYCK